MKNETARREIESLDYYLQNHTDDYSEESHTAMMMAVKALEQEPKTGHWIPVSERLPEEAYGCLVTIGIDNVLTGECVPTILSYLVGYDGETWNDSDGIPLPYEVTAWMPLPDPYKAESEE